MNEKEKEAIDMLNIFRLEHKFFNIRQSDNLEDNIEIVLNLVEKLQKENEKLKALDLYNSKMIANISARHFQDKQKIRNSIQIQNIKEKIEEIDEELEIMRVDNMYGRYKEYGGKSKWERLFLTKYGMHDALQELLEGRK